MILFVIIVFLINHCVGSFLNLSNFELDLPHNYIKNINNALEDKTIAISSLCKSNVLYFINNLLKEETWALEMYDAGAKFPSGILHGNILNLGSYDECINIKTNSPSGERIFGKYCISTIPREITPKVNFSESTLLKVLVYKPKIPVPDILVGIQLAVCFPHSCSANEIQTIYRKIGSNRVFHENLCQTKESQPKIGTGGRITFAAVFIISLLMISSTTYDVLYNEKGYPILTSFSLLRNGKSLFNLQSSPNEISCLNGIRVIMTFWLVLGHSFSIRMALPLKRPLWYWDILNNPTNMYIAGAFVCIDSFLLLTGLLYSYNYLKSPSKGNKFDCLKLYMYRYLKLTPVLAAIILVHVTILEHLSSGPIWSMIHHKLVDACKRNWWKTLLYIQNYSNEEDICIPQSWYLAIDSQLIILLSALLILLKKWPKRVLLLTVVLAVCSICYSFGVAWMFDLNMNVFGNVGDKRKNFARYYYYATPSRAVSWLLGIILGYIIFDFKQRQNMCVINKKLIWVFNIISFITIIGCLYGGHELIFGKYVRIKNALYLSLKSPLWSITVGCLIFSCVSGNASVLNWFLSLPIFKILSKLCFTVYLSHYTVIHYIAFQTRSEESFKFVRMFHVFCGDLMFTLAIASVLLLSIEMPIENIVRFLIGTDGSRNKKIKTK